MKKNIDKLALAECNDTGKPLWLVKNIDIPGAINNIEFFASHTDNFADKSHSTGRIVGAISSWNLPLFLLTWKIAPALITGNCVILNPPVYAPMTAYLFSQFCIEAGLPDGVLNIIHGYEYKVGQAFMSFSEIKTLSFSGSSNKGMKIKGASVQKEVLLELGGKNPSIIFNDCNYEEMLDATIYSSFSNQGENCLGASRLFIEKSIYEKFKKDLVDKSKNLKSGDPLEPDTHVGAVVSEEYLKKVTSYIESVKEDSGMVLCGGGNAEINSSRVTKGFFVEPTVIENLHNKCNTYKEDIYGPVVILMPFKTEEDVILMANDSAHGFSSIIWTGDLKRAERVASKINTGIVWVNSWMLKNMRIPYEGVKGLSLESGGLKAMRFFN
jgi:aminomuconate-semialdehyde/2-hydroxymuconate-6-semialdehyde dehydrogenase